MPHYSAGQWGFSSASVHNFHRMAMTSKSKQMKHNVLGVDFKYSLDLL